MLSIFFVTLGTWTKIPVYEDATSLIYRSFLYNPVYLDHTYINNVPFLLIKKKFTRSCLEKISPGDQS